MNARIKKKNLDGERGKCCFPENRSCFDFHLTCLNMQQLKSTSLQNVLLLWACQRLLPTTPLSRH